jgi:hypothetical protein
MATWLGAHALGVLVVWYVLSAVVSGMPAPEANAAVAYRWAYRSLHVLAGDFSQYLQSSPLGIRSKTNGMDV